MTPEDLYVAEDEDLVLLRGIRRRSDEQAQIAGVAVLEHEQRQAEIRKKYEGSISLRNMRLGALYYEFRATVEECSRLVNAGRKDAEAIGTQALERLGIDPASGTYRIDHNNGVVNRLEGLEWKPLRRTQ